MENIVRLIAGILLLTMGKRLFWMFVGIIGFLVGFNYAYLIPGVHEPWAVVAVALVLGLMGSVLAVLAQAAAIGVAGFLAGGFVTIELLRILDFAVRQYYLPLYVIGGVVGIVVMFLVFDWALIFLSSVAGALLLTQTLTLAPEVRAIVFIFLALTGVIVQVAGSMIRERRGR